jgi:DNA-binding SARP family transcriptional activator
MMDLKIYTLGRFSIVRNGESIRFNRKPPKKPLLMLKALVALGGREVRKELIADAIWPDSEGDAADRAFATTLHRLRKLMKNHKTVLLNNGCLTLNQALCWVDVWAFERLCGKADAAWERGDRKSIVEAVNTTQKVLQIYSGPFLKEEYEEPWSALLRDRLRSKYLRCIGKIGHYWEQTNQLEKAIDCYQRTLEADGSEEESYRRLMACYFRQGKNEMALSVYDRCKRVFSLMYGIAPSRETETLRKAIQVVG